MAVMLIFRSRGLVGGIELPCPFRSSKVPAVEAADPAEAADANYGRLI
jgi:hypothetical protein